MENVVALISKVNIINTGKKCVISDSNRKKIKSSWQELIALNPRMFNGPVYSVDKVEEIGDEITLTCSLSDYAHYRYSQNNDLGNEACRNVYGSCLVVTRDNYVVVSMNGGGSEFVGKIQAIGGAIDPMDKEFETGCLDCEKTALRELQEETGEEIGNSIKSISPGFLLTNGKKFGIVSIAISSMSKSQMEKSFERFKECSGNDEINKLVFFHKDKLIELDKYSNRQDLGVVEMIWKYFKDK